MSADVARTAGVALERLEQKCYGAILVELLMAGDGAFVVLDRINQMASPPPVIAVTAAGATEVGRLNRSIVRAVIFKPFDVDQLAAYLAVTRGVTKGTKPIAKSL